MSHTPPVLKKIRIQELKPGMTVARVNRDLDFVYVEVDKILPLKRMTAKGPRTQSYKVYLVGWAAGNGTERHMAPFIVQNRGTIDVVQEA